jgi:hypothetical protein
MELKYAHLADYASAGEHGKMLIVGIFDTVKAGPQRPIGVPPFTSLARCGATSPKVRSIPSRSVL